MANFHLAKIIKYHSEDYSVFVCQIYNTLSQIAATSNITLLACRNSTRGLSAIARNLYTASTAAE